MIHAIAYLLFILPFTAWLGQELKLKYNLKKYWWPLLLASALGLAGGTVDGHYGTLYSNFFQHVTGGASAILLFIYILKTLRIDLQPTIVTLFAFGFVCSLGVMNELAEYFIEAVFRIGPFSMDSHDTWRDLVANTTGASIIWLCYGIYGRFKNSSSDRNA